MNVKQEISSLQSLPPKLTAEKARQVLEANGLSVSKDQAITILEFLFTLARQKN